MSYLGRKSGRAALISDDIPDNSITAAKIVAGAVDADIGDNAVTLAKMAGGTDGQIITYDASGDPVAVGPGSDGEVLTSTGAGSPPAFEAVPAGGITEADQWRLTTSTQGAIGGADITSNLERNDVGFDKIGTGMSESTGIFTFPSTGIWHVQAVCQIYIAANNYVRFNAMYIKTNAGTALAYCDSSLTPDSASEFTQNASCSTFLDVTDTATNANKIIFHFNVNSNSTYLKGSSSQNTTHFTFIRLGDT